MIRFESFIEGQRYFKKNIPNEFIDSGYFNLNKDKTVTSKVCGISITNNQTYLFLPKGVNKNLGSDRKLKLARKVFKSLLKYKDTIRLSHEENEWLGKENSEIESIDNIGWLINDYFNHGLYKEEYKKEENNGNGRIDWARTIKLKLPIVNNSEFLYLDLITNKNQINNNSIISAIHNNIIFECCNNFGWLYDKKANINKIDLHLTIEEQIIVLKRNLRETFSGYQVDLLQKMIIYLEVVKNGSIEFNLLTPYYYYIWEVMIKNAMKHNDKLQNYVPKPYWDINGEIYKTKQIPDVLIDKGTNLIIIDAKYYSIITNEVRKFPGWESVVKQMYYNLSLNGSYDNIQNIFFMPETILSEYKYIGKTAVQGKEDIFGYVYAYSINLDIVLKSYLDEINLEHILNNIISHQKSLNYKESSNKNSE
ncbi:LlaJI family restriction endonuclease [Mammaliicoccus sp. G-M28]|uniref:LlaJI family restriction endonuclease n=1 Tax=Mammaliicoccus sp. G-M28 TaxID=2898688 RepID=UPI001EFB961E|nr:LlaJI family restriction endonuclease [Mammaliicoccus sp. G-M28]